MKLLSARSKSYKAITDTGKVKIEEDTTTLVGKNESGKSAFLEALYRVNPAPSGLARKFEELRDYPRRKRNADRDQIPEVEPIEAVFKLEDDDVRAVEEKLGSGIFQSDTITVRRNYENTRSWAFDLDEKAVVRQFASDARLPDDTVKRTATLEALLEEINEREEPTEAIEELRERLVDFNLDKEVREILKLRLPDFLYFGNYNTLPGRFSIPEIQQADEDDLSEGERTALAFLRLAGVDAEEFVEEDYETRKAALEAAAVQITDEVFEYWSQNRDLRVDVDVDLKTEQQQNTAVRVPYLEIRIYNDRHRVSLNFGERSTGFVWFFSFLAYFSEFRGRDKRLVLLLDEPGLGLHAAAQGDLLRFIDERLAPDHQVLHTTHSPFMVDATKLDKVRTVEDKDGEGTKISADVLSVSADTRFPLQNALGYLLSQTLFIAPDSLVVEGPSDILYLQIISSHLRSLDRTGLDDRWVLVPAGGMDKIPAIIALFGSQLNLAVILDVAGSGNQRIDNLVSRGIFERNKLFPLTEFTGTKEADIEDLFDIGFYLELLNESGVATIAESDLPQGARLVKRVEQHTGGFDHYRPAAYLQREQDTILAKLDDDTLNRFESLFEKVNGTL